MATLNFNNARVLVGGYEITSDLHALSLNVASEVLDSTTFGATTRSRIGGLKTANVAAKGYVNLGSSQSDPVLFNKVGGGADLVTVFGNGVTVGSTAAGSGYGMPVVDSKYSQGDAVGKILPFDFEAQSQGNLVRAVVLNDFTSAALSTGTTNGTAFQLPTLTTCESLYAGFHVTGITLGGSVQALIQAASSSGFAGVTTRGTFAAQSSKTGLFLTPVAASALSTDQPYWRVQIVVSSGASTGPLANGLVWMGLQGF